MSKIALDINRRLSPVYANLVPEFDRPRLDPVSQLIYAILSQRTRSPQADQAYDALNSYFVDWIVMLYASVKTIEGLISHVTFADQKALRLRIALFEILHWNNEECLSLELIRNMSDVDAAAKLRELHGVGWKTSHAILLLSVLQRALLPVDTHAIRALKRIGLIPHLVDDPAHIHAIARGVLPGYWDTPELECEYFLVKRHGQNCCVHTGPHCNRCPLLDICKYGQTVLGYRTWKR